MRETHSSVRCGVASPRTSRSTRASDGSSSTGRFRTSILQKERGLSAEDAYSLASIAVNYVVGEAVDDVLMVYGAIPKKIFTSNRAFWSRP